MASAMTLEEALPQVLKKAKYQNGVKKGLREVVKYLDKRVAHLCILAKDCDEPQYTRLVEALCTLHQIPLLKVSEIEVFWLKIRGVPNNKFGIRPDFLQCPVGYHLRKIIGISN